jgi:hypothetical protein
VSNDINNRSPTYFVARGVQRCGCCGELTPVIGLMLPAGHQTLAVDAEEAAQTPAADIWETADGGAILFFIEYLPVEVQDRLRHFATHYHFDYSETMDSSYWMNHCACCGKQLGDLELYCEPEGAFMPISPDAAATIRLHEVLEPFEAQAPGYAYAPQFAEYMQRDATAGYPGAF